MSPVYGTDQTPSRSQRIPIVSLAACRMMKTAGAGPSDAGGHGRELMMMFTATTPRDTAMVPGYQRQGGIAAPAAGRHREDPGAG